MWTWLCPTVALEERTHLTNPMVQSQRKTPQIDRDDVALYDPVISGRHSCSSNAGQAQNILMGIVELGP